MTYVTLPNNGINAGWTPTENGWSDAMNLNLRKLDALMNLRVVDKDLNSPPGSPTGGQVYLAGPAATGAWAGNSNSVAFWMVGDDLTSAWAFAVPKTGWRVYVMDEDLYYRYNGTAWVPEGVVVQSVVSAATVTPTTSNDLVKVTAQAAALALANPTGTAVDGKQLVTRIKDNGTARAITYGTQYRQMNVALPSTTVAGKTLYLTWRFNAEDTKWDLVSVAQQA